MADQVDRGEHIRGLGDEPFEYTDAVTEHIEPGGAIDGQEDTPLENTGAMAGIVNPLLGAWTGVILRLHNSLRAGFLLELLCKIELSELTQLLLEPQILNRINYLASVSATEPVASNTQITGPELFSHVLARINSHNTDNNPSSPSVSPEPTIHLHAQRQPLTSQSLPRPTRPVTNDNTNLPSLISEVQSRQNSVRLSQAREVTSPPHFPTPNPATITPRDRERLASPPGLSPSIRAIAPRPRNTRAATQRSGLTAMLDDAMDRRDQDTLSRISEIVFSVKTPGRNRDLQQNDVDIIVRLLPLFEPRAVWAQAFRLISSQTVPPTSHIELPDGVPLRVGKILTKIRQLEQTLSWTTIRHYNAYYDLCQYLDEEESRISATNAGVPLTQGNPRNHIKAQAYIECIAFTLKIPVSEARTRQANGDALISSTYRKLKNIAFNGRKIAKIVTALGSPGAIFVIPFSTFTLMQEQWLGWTVGRIEALCLVLRDLKTFPLLCRFAAACGDWYTRFESDTATLQSGVEMLELFRTNNDLEEYLPPSPNEEPDFPPDAQWDPTLVARGIVLDLAHSLGRYDNANTFKVGLYTSSMTLNINQDFLCWGTGELLTTTAIDGYICCLPPRAHLYVCKTFEYGGHYTEDVFLPELTKAIPSQTRIMMCPIATGNHYILCVVHMPENVHTGPVSLQLYDSLGFSILEHGERVQSFIQRYIRYAHPQGNLFMFSEMQFIVSPRQTGGVDCGVFVLLLIKELMEAREIPASRSPLDITEARNEFARTLWEASHEWANLAIPTAGTQNSPAMPGITRHQNRLITEEEQSNAGSLGKRRRDIDDNGSDTSNGEDLDE